MAEKKGFFKRLVSGLTKTRNSIASSINSVFSGFSKIDEDFYEELEEILIMADMGVYTTEKVIDSLREIDFYMRDTLRAMKTGKHNKANVNAIDDEEFKELGWVSLVDMFYLYKKDIDYYMEIVELMKNT